MLLRINLFVCVFVRALNHFYLFWAAYVLVLGRRGVSFAPLEHFLPFTSIWMQMQKASFIGKQRHPSPFPRLSPVWRLKLKFIGQLKTKYYIGVHFYSRRQLSSCLNTSFFSQSMFFFIANRTAVQRFLVDFYAQQN